MTPKDNFKYFLKSGRLEKPLVAPLIGYHTTWLYNQNPIQVSENGNLMAILQLRALKFYGHDFVSHYLDLTILPEALGVKVTWSTYPPSIEVPLKDAEEASNVLSTADPQNLVETSKRLKASIEAIKVLHELVGDRYPIMAFIHGPFTLIADLLSPVNTLRLVKRKPDQIKDLIQKATPFLKNLSDIYIEQGADIVVVDEMATPLISPRDFQVLLLESLNRLITLIKQKSNVILHICGMANHLLGLMASTEADILSVDKYINIPEAIKTYSNKIFMGNIGATEIYNWDITKIRLYVRELIAKTQGERLIVATSCDVPVYTPPQNIKALIEATKE
jgi:MtaA/CmuA family methyltransferase